MNTFFIRMLIYIGAIFFGILYEFSRFGLNEGVALRNENGAANRLRVYFRRRRAMGKCAAFVSRKNKAIILKNANVVFAYDTGKKIFVCLNAKNVKQTISVEWEMQIKAINEDVYDNSFERFFDSICSTFDERTSYKGLVAALKENFNNVNEILQPSSEQIREEIHETQKAFEQSTIINVNEASENALAQLPGISIAMAKKIVKRVNTKGDYLSIEQMCEEMKIKSHFRVQLCNYLCAKPVLRHKKEVKNSDSRIIDNNRIVDNNKIIGNDRKNNDDRIIDL